MIIIPEIKTVVILVPRTGSSSLRKAIAARYPGAIHLYRHMEADGVPHGYDRWRKVGMLRDPVARLWSLYKFLRTLDGRHDPEYIEAMRKSVDMPFNEWLVTNEATFTDPYSRQDGLMIHPFYACRHPMPETRKSQWVYLRPDLGTELFLHSVTNSLWEELDLPECEVFENSSGDTTWPGLSYEAAQHISRFHYWDLKMVGRIPLVVEGNDNRSPSSALEKPKSLDKIARAIPETGI